MPCRLAVHQCTCRELTMAADCSNWYSAGNKWPIVTRSFAMYPAPEQIAAEREQERTAKWDHRFIGMARHIAAEWSKDPSTKVGAVLVDTDRVVIGTGFNGFPRGVDDDPERYANREMKLDLTVHAEMNAILTANSSARGSTLYCTHPPCVRCAAHIIQAKVSRVVSVAWDRPDWAKSIERSQMIFREARVVFDMIEGNMTMKVRSSRGSRASMVPT